MKMYYVREVELLRNMHFVKFMCKMYIIHIQINAPIFVMKRGGKKKKWEKVKY